MAKAKSVKAEKKQEFKTASYNPRSMSANSKKALKKSLESFDDISGITVNSRTGNVFAGNHRWEQLKVIHGEANLTVRQLHGEFHLILSGEEFTGFLMRIVDWHPDKEKAANIAANSQHIQGEFTSGLQEVLADVEDFLGQDFIDLRFDDLSIDFGDLSAIGNSGITDPGKLTERIREDSDEENEDLHVEPNKHGEVKIIKTSIKMLVPGDKADMIRDDLLDFINSRPYADEVEFP